MPKYIIHDSMNDYIVFYENKPTAEELKAFFNDYIADIDTTTVYEIAAEHKVKHTYALQTKKEV